MSSQLHPSSMWQLQSLYGLDAFTVIKHGTNELLQYNINRVASVLGQTVMSVSSQLFITQWINKLSD